MAIMQSCCFWNSVRKGSYASAIYTLIFFGFSSLIFMLYIVEEQDYLSGKRKQPIGESLLERGDITLATVIFNILFLVCSVLLILASLLLIVGLHMNKRLLLIPWIFLMLCDIIIELTHLIYLSIVKKVTFDPIVGFIFTIDFFIMCLNLYCLVCVVSQYQEYMENNGYGQDQLRAEVVFHVTPCHKPSALKKSKTKSLRLLSPSLANTSNHNTHFSLANDNEEINQNLQEKDFDTALKSVTPTMTHTIATAATTTTTPVKRINFSDDVLVATTTTTTATPKHAPTFVKDNAQQKFQIPIITFGSTANNNGTTTTAIDTVDPCMRAGE